MLIKTENVRAKTAQQCVQWTGGYAARFLAFFVALSVSRFDGESQPAHLPLTRAVRRQVQMQEQVQRQVLHHMKALGENGHGK